MCLLIRFKQLFLQGLTIIRPCMNGTSTHLGVSAAGLGLWCSPGKSSVNLQLAAGHLSHKISQVHTTPPKDSKCLAGSSKVNTDGIYCKIRGASMSKPTCMTSGKGSAPESMRSTKIQATLAQRPRAWSWVAIPVWHRHTCPTSNIHNALSLQVVYR